MNKKILASSVTLCLLALAGLPSFKAQTSTKFFISFKNKTGTPYTVSNPGAFLSAKSVNRRTYYNITTDVTDLPVTPAYVSQIEALAHVKVMYAIKWLNGVLVYIDTLQANTLATINTFSFVAGNMPTNRYKLILPEQPFYQGNTQQAGMRAANTQSYDMGGSSWQNKQIEVDCLHNEGYLGEGMTIAVLDVGFNNVDVNPVFADLRNRNGILGTRDFVGGGTNVYDDPDHGAEVLSCMAASRQGLIWGSAPGANYWLLRTEDDNSETPTEEYNWVRGAEFADSVGADILTTSLGYTQFDNPSENHTYATLNGKTAPMSIAATMAARKGLFVLNAAGNEGGNSWQYISVPGDADSICTVGAIDSAGIVASFSSTGPTADGRIKPDLVARGVGTWVSFTNGVGFPGNGTSFATPVLAGGVACFWQANRWYSNMKVLQLLKASGSNAANPNNSIGWGLPKLCTAAPLGIAEMAARKASFIASPNPFHANLTISLQSSDIQITSIELVDLLGKVAQSVNIPVLENSSTSINTASLPEGVYILKLYTSSGILSKKLIKQ